MNIILKTFLTITAVTIAALFAAQTAFADTTCQPIYGGGQTCVQTGNLVINKTVMNPATGGFVENLGVNDPKYGPDQTVTFQITITNRGTGALTSVNIQDIFPQFVGFQANDQVKNATFDGGNLNPNESRTFTLNGKIVPADQLPGEQTCVVNQAIARANGQESRDNAQLCIQKSVTTQPVQPQPAQPGKGGVVTQPQPVTTKGGKQVFAPQPVTTTPATGPEMLALFGLIPSAAAGFFLRRKTSR